MRDSIGRWGAARWGHSYTSECPEAMGSQLQDHPDREGRRHTQPHTQGSLVQEGQGCPLMKLSIQQHCGQLEVLGSTSPILLEKEPTGRWLSSQICALRHFRLHCSPRLFNLNF